MRIGRKPCEQEERIMKHNIKNLTLAAMFLAIGLVLPFLTGQIPRDRKSVV